MKPCYDETTIRRLITNHRVKKAQLEIMMEQEERYINNLTDYLRQLQQPCGFLRGRLRGWIKMGTQRREHNVMASNSHKSNYEDI